MGKYTKKQIIKGSIVIGLYLLFLIWVKSWMGLIIVPFIFDIYFSKKIPWGFWKKMKPSFARTLFSWLDAIVFALIAVTLVNIFFFQNYQIPTSSLEKSLLVGDHLYVSKLSYGPRIPNTPLGIPFAHNTIGEETKSYLNTPHWDYKRVKGFGDIKRNDIVVFNYPSGDTVLSKSTNSDFYNLAYEVGYMANKLQPQVDSMSRLEQLQYFSHIYELGKKTLSTYPEFGRVITRPVDRRDNYVKRCLGLPGDTLQIIDSKVYINGKLNLDAPDVQFNYYVETTGPAIPEKIFKELGVNKDDIRLIRIGNGQESKFLLSNNFKGENNYVYLLPLTKKMVAKLKANTALVANIVQEPATRLITDTPYRAQIIYPLNGNTHWDKNNYGPIWIPKQGETIKLTLNNYPLYERCIRTYEHNKLEIKDGKIYINGKESDSYTFKMDYYWMMGDNRDQSLDSRYWGFVPIDHIVGKPIFVWLSLEKDNDWFNGKIRWNRFFKWVK